MVNFNYSKRDDLQKIVDTTDWNNIYIWYANLDWKETESVWWIEKILISWTIIKKLRPSKNWIQDNEFNYKWSDRLTITYI